MTKEIFSNGELTLSRKETYGKSKQAKSEPVFTSRMEKREYYKGVNCFDIRNVLDIKGFLKDIRTDWNTYVSQVNQWIQHNPVKKLVLTGIFTIVLGFAASNASAAIVPEYTYQVQNGEKVTDIAAAHGVTVQSIYDANGVSSIDGQKILLPKVDSMTVTATILNVRSQPNTESSIVGKYKKGDSVKVSFVENGWAAIMMDGRINYVSADYLTKVAAAANTTVKAANQPQANTNISSSVYVIKSGDTFTKIGKEFGISVSSIQELNPAVNPSQLKIGQKINIAAASAKAQTKSETMTNNNANTKISTSVYVIKPGDTFTKIGKASGVSVSAIQELNPTVEPAKLKIGQKINIPAVPAKAQTNNETITNNNADTKISPAVYVIKPGDTFTKIGKAFGVSVSAIQELNPTVTAEKLKIGQKINIPAAAAKEQTKSETITNNDAKIENSSSAYVIKSGDTFTKISKTFAISVSSIQALNPTVNPSKLKIGQKINIPVATAAAASASTSQIKVAAYIVGVDPKGTFQFITSNGSSTYTAKASGVMLDEVMDHEGKKLMLTLEGKRGQQMTLKTVH